MERKIKEKRGAPGRTQVDSVARRDRQRDREREKDAQAYPEGGAGLNYARVAHQSPGWPMASTSFLLVDWELYMAAVFVHRISLTD